MNMKEHILAALREQFNSWDELLASMSEEQIAAPHFDYNWSIKDVIAHLWGWQQISTARMEAGALDREPEFPKWIVTLGEDWEDNADGKYSYTLSQGESRVLAWDNAPHHPNQLNVPHRFHGPDGSNHCIHAKWRS